MLVTSKIPMALDRRGVAETIHAVQGDSNTRAVEMALTCAEQPWTIPSGASALVRFRKPDGTGGVYDALPDGTKAVTMSDNKLTALLAPQVLTVPGCVMVQVELNKGSSSLATFSFHVHVQEDPSVGAMDSKDYYNLTSYVASEVERVLGTGGAGNLTARIEAIEDDIADLKYVPISITSASNNVGTVEMGRVIDSVTVSWVLNKAPKSQTVNGEAVATSARSKTFSGLNLTATKKFTVSATDDRGAVATKDTSVIFYNGVYYGVGAELNMAALTKALSNTKARTFQANAGAGQYIWYCLPARLGECTFTVGGFDGGFDLVVTQDYTNPSGYTERYYIYRSANAGLGSTSVGVK